MATLSRASMPSSQPSLTEFPIEESRCSAAPHDQVCDRDNMFDDTLGEMAISLDELRCAESHSYNVPLSTGGEVSFTVSWESALPPPPTQLPPTPETVLMLSKTGAATRAGSGAGAGAGADADADADAAAAADADADGGGALRKAAVAHIERAWLNFVRRQKQMERRAGEQAVAALDQ
eukprot:4589492-Pleurochrysis_carterae.AAC.1